MRFSSVVGLAVLSIAALTSGCRVSVETKERFTLSSGEATVREDATAWAGEPIVIEIKGVGIAVNGGVKVIADPAATKVTATTRFLAMAFEKADADLSIQDAIGTFTLTHTGAGESGEIRLACDHGNTHGTSDSGSSGCEYVEVRIPAGDARSPVRLKTLSGNGTLTLQLANATIGATDSNGRRGIEGNSQSGLDADLPATQGAAISLVAEGDIDAKLPANFAADTVILSTEDEAINLGPFTDIKNGTGQGGRGTAGTGLVELHLTARGLGEITLR